jgi:hypothetical protein
VPLLFSYGTLQQEGIQRALFGRSLRGERDLLIGFRIAGIDLDDPDALQVTGKARHSIAQFTGSDDDRVTGTVFEITDGDLAVTDRYEPAPYVRVATTLASGRTAWVYTDSRATR